MIELSELNSYQEASLFCSDLSEWQEGPQVLTYGAILLCRKGRAVLNVNYKDWDLYEGAVITLFPNDVVEVKKVEPSASCEGDTCAGMNASAFEVEMLKYNPSLLREASLQLEQTVYSALREDRCRQDSPVVTHIIESIFSLLRLYFEQHDCTCISQLVLYQLKAFFIGFHEYLQRNPQNCPDANTDEILFIVVISDLLLLFIYLSLWYIHLIATTIGVILSTTRTGLYSITRAIVVRPCGIVSCSTASCSIVWIVIS